ncbi:MAG: hypothetical protein Q9220_007757 [cf. Caloplaca sp. 1 TL-2023]
MSFLVIAYFLLVEVFLMWRSHFDLTDVDEYRQWKQWQYDKELCGTVILGFLMLAIQILYNRNLDHQRLSVARSSPADTTTPAACTQSPERNVRASSVTGARAQGPDQNTGASSVTGARTQSPDQNIEASLEPDACTQWPDQNIEAGLEPVDCTQWPDKNIEASSEPVACTQSPAQDLRASLESSICEPESETPRSNKTQRGFEFHASDEANIDVNGKYAYYASPAGSSRPYPWLRDSASSSRQVTSFGHEFGGQSALQPNFSWDMRLAFERAPASTKTISDTSASRSRRHSFVVMPTPKYPHLPRAPTPPEVGGERSCIQEDGLLTPKVAASEVEAELIPKQPFEDERVARQEILDVMSRGIGPSNTQAFCFNPLDQRAHDYELQIESQGRHYENEGESQGKDGSDEYIDRSDLFILDTISEPSPDRMSGWTADSREGSRAPSTTGTHFWKQPARRSGGLFSKSKPNITSKYHGQRLIASEEGNSSLRGRFNDAASKLSSSQALRLTVEDTKSWGIGQQYWTDHIRIKAESLPEDEKLKRFEYLEALCVNNRGADTRRTFAIQGTSDSYELDRLTVWTLTNQFQQKVGTWPPNYQRRFTDEELDSYDLKAAEIGSVGCFSTCATESMADSEATDLGPASPPQQPFDSSTTALFGSFW